MKRSAPKRRTPVKRVNRKRKAAEWKRAYGSKERVEWVHRQDCILRSVDSLCQLPSEAAHVGNGGMGRKTDAYRIVPLCTDHHRELHQSGRRTFEWRYGISLADYALRTDARWQSVLASQENA